MTNFELRKTFLARVQHPTLSLNTQDESTTVRYNHALITHDEQTSERGHCKTRIVVRSMSAIGSRVTCCRAYSTVCMNTECAYLVQRVRGTERYQHSKVQPKALYSIERLVLVLYSVYVVQYDTVPVWYRYAKNCLPNL